MFTFDAGPEMENELAEKWKESESLMNWCYIRKKYPVR
jgi:hypothetical protein